MMSLLWLLVMEFVSYHGLLRSFPKKTIRIILKVFVCIDDDDVACSLNHSHTHYLISDVNVIHEVDYSTHQILKSYHGHHGTVFCLRYGPDDSSFISGSDDSSIRLWTVENCLNVF